MVGVSSLLALVPDDLEGLVVPVMDARRNNVYAGFYQDDQLIAPEGHFPFEEVLEHAATSEQVTFVGEVTAFKEQIASSPPSATYYETLPDAVKIGRLGLKKTPVSLHDFVPNYLKRVEGRGKLAQRPHGNNDLLHQAPMMKGTIKKGSVQDAAAILAVMEDVYEASPWKLEQIEADLEQESTSYFLAVDEGKS